jgi:hypothetical protein
MRVSRETRTELRAKEAFSFLTAVGARLWRGLQARWKNKKRKVVSRNATLVDADRFNGAIGRFFFSSGMKHNETARHLYI